MFLSKQETLLEVLQGRKVLRVNGLAELTCSVDDCNFSLQIHQHSQVLSLSNFDNLFSCSKWIREADKPALFQKQTQLASRIHEYRKFIQSSIETMKTSLAGQPADLCEKAVQILVDSLSNEYYRLLHEALDYGVSFKDTIHIRSPQHLQNT